MEKDLTDIPFPGINSLIRDSFNLEKKDVRTYSPLTLAYIGDAVFDIIIRTIIVDKGNSSVNRLHKLSASYVSAKSQNLMVNEIFEEFTKEEKDIFRRGKNTKMHTVAKNASLSEYRNATGFEAVLGYLYLLDNTDRLFYLVNLAINNKDERSK